MNLSIVILKDDIKFKLVDVILTLYKVTITFYYNLYRCTLNVCLHVSHVV